MSRLNRPVKLEDTDDAAAHGQFAARSLRDFLRLNWRYRLLRIAGRHVAGSRHRSAVGIGRRTDRSAAQRIFAARIFFGHVWPAPGMGLRQTPFRLADFDLSTAHYAVGDRVGSVLHVRLSR